jgi:hypothetical protein
MALHLNRTLQRPPLVSAAEKIVQVTKDVEVAVVDVEAEAAEAAADVLTEQKAEEWRDFARHLDSRLAAGWGCFHKESQGL